MTVSVYWRDVFERVATTAGYTGIVAMVGDLLGAVNVTMPEVFGASTSGALLALAGTWFARFVGDRNTASLDPEITYGKHHRA